MLTNGLTMVWKMTAGCLPLTMPLQGTQRQGRAQLELRPRQKVALCLPFKSEKTSTPLEMTLLC